MHGKPISYFVRAAERDVGAFSAACEASSLGMSEPVMKLAASEQREIGLAGRSCDAGALRAQERDSGRHTETCHSGSRARQGCWLSATHVDLLEAAEVGGGGVHHVADVDDKRHR